MLHTSHGDVETPVFMPVGTAGTVKGMTQEMLEDLGAQLLLANTYHLYLRPGHDVIRALGGLHRFMAWPHAILTDSGGFQVMSLKGLGRVTEDGVWFRSHLDGSAHFLSPERAVEIQLALGADIIMSLDECVEYPASHETLQRAVKLTGRWARRARDYYITHGSRVSGVGSREGELGSRESGVGCRDTASGGPHKPDAQDPASASSRPLPAPNTPDPTPDTLHPTSSLFGIIQGGVDRDLRRQSAEELLELGFEGHALGGFSVGEPKAEMYDLVEYTTSLLPVERPRYLMGVGTPADLVEGVARGIDMFDCVLPTRNARNACVFTSEGRVIIKNARYAGDESPLDPACYCSVCRRYSRSYLRHLFVAGEMLGGILATQHNLYFYLDTLRKVRQSILSGEFADLCARVRGTLTV